MKTKTIIAVILCTASVALCGTEYKQVAPAKTVPPVSLYGDTELDISLLGSGSWTQTTSTDDRYFGVDHAFGGTLAVNYFFMKYFGVGLSGSGWDVANVSTPARVATDSNERRFVGNVLENLTFRYPIGTSAFAPYVRVGGGAIFNGGNATFTEPNVSFGKTLQFEAVEHNAQAVAEGALGLEYRINKNFGVVTEAAYDKVCVPHSNFATVRVGLNVAF